MISMRFPSQQPPPGSTYASSSDVKATKITLRYHRKRDPPERSFSVVTKVESTRSATRFPDKGFRNRLSWPLRKTSHGSCTLYNVLRRVAKRRARLNRKRQGTGDEFAVSFAPVFGPL
jgi:hypothetical protein